MTNTIASLSKHTSRGGGGDGRGESGDGRRIGVERGRAKPEKKWAGRGVVGGGTFLNHEDLLRLSFNQTWTASTPTATAVVPVTSHIKKRVSAPRQPSHFFRPMPGDWSKERTQLFLLLVRGSGAVKLQHSKRGPASGRVQPCHRVGGREGASEICILRTPLRRQLNSERIISTV